MIPKFQSGGYWYNGIADYDPNKYLASTTYNTKKLIDGDMLDNRWKAWASSVTGLDSSRYQPTSGHGAFGIEGPHYNYTLEVEKQPYYKQFTEDLIKDGEFTPMGEAWARATDELLPPNSPARFYDGDTLRNSWTPTTNDVHGNAPKTFNSLPDYVRYVRNDQILGARHNVFLKTGKRYFYTDAQGQKHFVDPNIIGNYQVSKDYSVEWDKNNNVQWFDYELTGPNNSNQRPFNPTQVNWSQYWKDKFHPQHNAPTTSTIKTTKKGEIPVGDADLNGFDWAGFGQKLKGLVPDLLATGRYALSLANNERVYNEMIKGLRPNLKQSYHTYRQVFGDEAAKQQYYTRGAQVQTKAGRPFTSDAALAQAVAMEGQAKANELRAQGDLLDNQKIKETSAEAAAHADANRGRDTEIANYNIESLNRTNQELHNLLAQKYFANGTSTDNYLYGIESRLRQNAERNRALNEQIFSLDEEARLANDKEYQKAYSEFKSASSKYNTSDPAYQAAYKNLRNQIIRVKRESLLRRQALWAKSGTKIIYKKKDDLLYKAAKDAVQHFREMSKLLFGKRNNSKIKIDKLIPPPKKMQQGGAAPFMIYRPVAVGGETSIQSSTGGTSSSSKSSSNNQFDALKDLFKQLKGLPSDVSVVGKDIQKFFTESALLGDLSTDDMASFYLREMQYISQLETSKANHEAAKSLATEKDALNEIAVDTFGHYYVQDKNTKEIKPVTLNDLNNSDYIPLTNSQLLRMREVVPKMAFQDEIYDIVSNGIGMSKVLNTIKSMITKLGSNETVIEGYTQKQANNIKEGAQLLADAPDGIYRQSITKKDSENQIQYALNYILSALPTNMKNVLLAHAKMNNSNPAKFIEWSLRAGADTVTKEQYTAITGKGATNKDGSSSGLDSDITPELAFFMGMGDRNKYTMSYKTSDGIEIYTNSMNLTDENHHNLPNATLGQVSSGPYGSQYDLSNITMGDTLISPTGIEEVLITGGKIHAAELPVDQVALAQGVVKPDLKFLKRIEAADKEVRQAGILNRNDLNADQIKLINTIYAKHQLPIIYNYINNEPVLTSSYRRFAILSGQAKENAFASDVSFDGEVEELNPREMDQFESIMQVIKKNEKYKIDKGTSIGRLHWGKENIYKGLIFIPMVNSTISALTGTGYKANPSEYNKMEALQQQRDAAVSLNYRPAGSAASIKK